MSRKHRKLFPAFNTSSQSSNCLDSNDPACPNNCYGHPNFAYLPPPPPPPPPAVDESNHRFLNSIYFIILVCLISGIFLLLSYYAILVKPFAHFRRRRSRTSRSPPGQPGEEFQDDNMTVHPVWLITTVGLQQSMINSITTCRYKSGEGLIEGTECSVCLSEFQENEMLRLLPKCSHAFHIQCIDTWLRSHKNCPLCRAPIVSERTSNIPGGSVEPSSENLNQNGDSFVENVEFGGSDESRIVDAEEQNAVQDEDPRVLKEVKKSSECSDQPLKGDGMYRLKSKLCDSVFISLPHVYADNLEGSSDNVVLENMQEHNFRRTESFAAVRSVSERAESIKRSLSCSGRLFHSLRT